MLHHYILAIGFSDFVDGLHSKHIFKSACEMFNQVLGILYSLLGVNPTTGTYEEAWNIVKNLYDVFSAIGAPLLVVFFVYGYCRDAVDIRNELQVEATIKMYIRMAISTMVLENVILWFPDMCGWAIKLLHVTKYESIALDSEKLSQNLADSTNIIFSFMLGVIFFIVVLAACVLMIWTCLGRFLNLYIIIPFATIALSTLAAGGQVSQTGYAYIKSILLYTFEIVAMGVVLAVAPAFVAASSIADSGTSEYLVLVEAIVKILTIAAGLKTSEVVIRKAFNL